jgi:glutamate dehydrogenase
MPDKHDVEKLKLIDAVQATLSQEDPALAEFARAFYDRGASEDLVAYTADELIGFARHAWQDFQNHDLGTHRVSIEDPAFQAAGKKINGVTVVEIVNDNMPFLVDSVMDELQESKIEVHLVLHPIFIVEREENGVLASAIARKKPPKRTDRQESLIHIHVTRIDSPEARAALKARLDKVLGDVRSVVDDFKPMQERLGEAIDTYKTTQIPGSSDELWEAIHFLEWMENDNFIFLGMREYMFEGGVEEGELSPHEGTGLGLLTDPDVRVLRRGSEFVQITPEIREFLKKPEPLIIAKANVKSTVHRRVHMDYVGAKLYDDEGNLIGELRIVGLFASTAYTEPTNTIPFLRRKVASVLARAGYGSESHSGRALRNVLEAFPRDELFQIDRDRLYDFSIAILQLDERPRIRVLSRPDKFDRYVSILVFVPRDRYSTEVRLNVGTYLASVYEGRVSAWYVTYPEGPLARVHYIIGRDKGRDAAARAGGPGSRGRRHGPHLVGQCARRPEEGIRPGPGAHARRSLRPVVPRRLQGGLQRPVRLVRHRQAGDPVGPQRHVDHLPPAGRLEGKPGFRSRSITGARRSRCRRACRCWKTWAFASSTNGPTGSRRPTRPCPICTRCRSRRAAARTSSFTEALQTRLESMFLAVWTGLAEDDGYNRLVLTGDLAWRDVAVIRALSKYLRQAGIRFSEDYMWSTLNSYPAIAAKLVELFHLRFNPDVTEKDRDLGTERLEG